MSMFQKFVNKDTDRNNFDLVRTSLAAIVVFSHLYALTQIESTSWFTRVFDADFAVKGFFAISGFLVTGSYLSSRSIMAFAEKRIRRIYPAYFVVVLFCLFIGLLTTTDEKLTFVTSLQTAKFFLANASLLNTIQPTLPGVFPANPLPALDGSLWTIKVEACLYVCVPLIVFCYRRFGDLAVTIVGTIVSLVWAHFFRELYTGINGAEIARQFPGQLSYFMLGAFLCVNKPASRNLPTLTAVCFALYVLSWRTAVHSFVEPYFYSTIVIFLATQAFRNLNFGRFGDLSFGIYLFHFPIIQLLVWFGLFAQSPLAGIVLTFTCTLLAASLSWNLVEKRFLKRSSHYVMSSAKFAPSQPLQGESALASDSRREQRNA